MQPALFIWAAAFGRQPHRGGVGSWNIAAWEVFATQMNQIHAQNL
jgi:hypothetical protein